MAKEHLGEAGWKLLVVKRKLKDETLGKALAVWTKLAQKGTPEERLAALDGVTAAAKKLLKDKAATANEDVAEWLDAAVKETVKVRGPIELEAKTAASKKDVASKDAKKDAKEQESPEEEGEEEGDLGARLLKGLNRVRNAKGEEALPFVAFPAKPAWALLVAPKVSADAKKALKESVENPKPALTGTCVFRDGKHTFVVEVMAPGLARGLAFAIQTMTTKKIPVRVTDGKTTSDDDTDVDGDKVGTSSEAEEKEEKEEKEEETKGPTAAEVEARRMAIVAKAKLLSERKELAPTLRNVALAASEAGVHIRKGDVPAALPLLDQCDALLASVAAAPSAPKAEPAKTTQAAAADAQKAKTAAGGAGSRAWQAARAEVVARLKGIAADLNASTHPERDKAIVQFGAVARQLTAQPSTPQQIAELETYLSKDDVVADICDLAFDMKTPLLGALSTLRAEVVPTG